jgi:hypothetical protein
LEVMGLAPASAAPSPQAEPPQHEPGARTLRAASAQRSRTTSLISISDMTLLLMGRRR